MTGSPLAEGAEPRRRIEIRPLDDGNRDAVIAFTGTRSDRPKTADYVNWRYRECPAMQAAVAMAGEECIATMFALRRTYHTPDGDRECLEPFEWHASEEWRALAPGLRIVQQYMKGEKPMIAVAGTDMAAGLLVKLKWTRIATADRYALPLSGAYLANRGRGPMVARVFDLVGRPFFTPRRTPGSPLALEPAGAFAPAVTAVAARQKRFALMRAPDVSTARWLQQAPPSVGHYLTFHARLDGDLVGWVSARVHALGPVLIGELLEVFLGDEHRSWYRALVAQASASLAAFGVDTITATTTCPDTAAALRALRFRSEDHRPVFAWWGKAAIPTGPVLIDGAISDHAFFPSQTAERSAWLEAPAGAIR